MQIFDYIIFGITFLVSFSIGIFIWFRSLINKNGSSSSSKTINNVLLLTLSLFASNMINSASIINNSFQVYSYGIQYYACILAISLSPLLGAYITGPLFYKLNVTNIFEYLELRFQSKLVRLLATCCYLAKSFLHCAICIIGPSGALNILTGIHKSTIIILIGCLATVYSMLIISSGGMKSIIWTNSIHVILTFVCVLTILIKGILLNVNGGLNNLWYLNKQNNRLNLINFNSDPYLHQSFWSLNIGFGLYWLIFYSVDQMSMQHFVSAKTLTKAKKTFLFNIPILFLFYTFTCLIGLVMFAIIYCDHIDENDSNKLVAYYFINNKLPGLSGLFMSSILAASFSSIISVLNSLSVIVCTSSNNNNKIFKSNFVMIKRLGLTVYFGLISILIAYFIELFNDDITQNIVSLIIGSIMAPISGIFFLGYLFKFVNKQGAITGLFSGLLIGFYLIIKFYFNNIKYPKLEYECHSEMNQTEILHQNNNNNNNNNNNDKSISYLWFICISFIVTLIIGILISLITCGFKSKKTKFNIIQNKDNNENDDEEIAYF
jgi:SSS family transporter